MPWTQVSIMRVAWVVALLFLAAPAAAEPGTFSGTTHLPVIVTGDAQTSGHGAFVTEGPGSIALLASGQGSMTRIEHRAYGLVTSSDPQAEVLWHQQVTQERLPLDGATLSSLAPESGFTLVVHSAGFSLDQGPVPAPQVVAGLSDDVVIRQQLERPLSLRILDRSEPFEWVIPADHLGIRTEAGRFHVTGGYTLWIQNARLLHSTDAPTVLEATTRIETHPGSLYNPLTRTWGGPGTHEEFVQETLLVEADGQLEIQFQDRVATAYAAPTQTHVLGDVQLPGLSGTITITGKDSTTHRVATQDTRLAGDLQLQLSDVQAGGRQARVSGTGDVASVTYGTVAATYDWGAITAVGFTAALLAGAAWLASQAKTILGGAAGGLVAGYARVQGPAILEHPVRHELYERIKAHPGITLAQLALDARLGASTLNHHLRHLERNEFVTLLRDGRYVRIFDRQSGAFAGDRKRMAAALSNPVTAAMAKHIQANPGVAQAELATRFGVTASTVTWHMQRLATVGLVEAQRAQKRTRYFVGESWGQVPSVDA